MIAPQLPEKGRQRFADMLTPLFPGAVAASWVIMTVVNSVIAQGLVVRMKNGIRPRPQYSAIDLPHWLSWPLVWPPLWRWPDQGNGNTSVAMPLWYSQRRISSWALLWCTALPAGCHIRDCFLVVFYLVIVISLWATLVVAGIGVVEQWFGLRDRTQTLPSQTGDDGDN